MKRQVRFESLLWASLPIALASALGARNWAAAQPPNARAPVQDIARRAQCSRNQEASDRANAEGIKQRTRELVSRIEHADPSVDAGAAVDRGDFRLIRGISMFGTSAIGVDCRVPRTNRWQGQPLTLAERFYSDVVQDCAGADRQRCRSENLLVAYGRAYNRVIVSDLRYPFADLCRPEPPKPLPSASYDDPIDYGFSELVVTEQPHDLSEAARRGSLASVSRLVAADGFKIDQEDPYGLTPLAWAIIRRRSDVAKLLLRAGASPLGTDCLDPGRTSHRCAWHSAAARRTSRGACWRRQILSA
jgi:hypothetical protein